MESPLIGSRSMQPIQRDILNWTINETVSNTLPCCSSGIENQSDKQECDTRSTAMMYRAAQKRQLPDALSLPLRGGLVGTEPIVRYYPEDQSQHSTSNAMSTGINMNLRPMHQSSDQATFLRREEYKQGRSRSAPTGGIKTISLKETSAMSLLARSHSTGTRCESSMGLPADDISVEYRDKQGRDEFYYYKHAPLNDRITFSSEYNDQWQEEVTFSHNTHSELHESTFELVNGGWTGKCGDLAQVDDSNGPQNCQPVYQCPYSNVHLDNIALTMPWYCKGSVETFLEQRRSKASKYSSLRDSLRRLSTPSRSSRPLSVHHDEKSHAVENGKDLGVPISSFTYDVTGDQNSSDLVGTKKSEKIKRWASLRNVLHTMSTKFSCMKRAGKHYVDDEYGNVNGI
eukprot:CFRG5073T1